MAEEAKAKVSEVLGSGFVGQGPKVEEFEDVLRSHFGTQYINTVNSATSGLHLVVHMLKKNFSHDDEILTTPLTCTATNFAILANNVKIKWVDVDPKTCNMDLDDLARKISPKTKAIMIVHWGGHACDLNKIEKIVSKCEQLYGFRPIIIEDCAHAWGAKYKNKLIGTHGNFAVFSFQAIKHFTTVDGGAIISPNNNYHRRAKLLRWYGLDRTISNDFRCGQNISEWGFKFHMNDMNAAVGLANYPHINNLIEKHKFNGNYLNQALKNISGIQLLQHCDDCESAYWIYTMHVRNRAGFMKKMKENNIATSLVHDRNDKHDCLKEYNSILPGLDSVSNTMICIPCGWWLKQEELDYMVETIRKGW